MIALRLLVCCVSAGVASIVRSCATCVSSAVFDEGVVVRCGHITSGAIVTLYAPRLSLYHLLAGVRCMSSSACVPACIVADAVGPLGGYRGRRVIFAACAAADYSVRSCCVEF